MYTIAFQEAGTVWIALIAGSGRPRRRIEGFFIPWHNLPDFPLAAYGKGRLHRSWHGVGVVVGKWLALAPGYLSAVYLDLMCKELNRPLDSSKSLA